MSPEKWEQIKGQIQDAFKDAEVSRGPLPEPERGELETVLFSGPLGRMKIEYVTRPVILETRTHGSRRIGSHTEVEQIYSETEFSHSLKAYKWDDVSDDWLEIDLRGSFQL